MNNVLRFRIATVVSVFALAVFGSTRAVAQTEALLYTFTGYSDGGYPYGDLVLDGSGNLYGTALFSVGSGDCGDGCGNVFELTPALGGWTFEVLHSFAGGVDGGNPTAGVIFDNLGNLYGTTDVGGTYGGGTIFELKPQTGGGWSEIILYSFTGGNDGAVPYAGLVLDRLGNLYGTTQGGGTYDHGTVFELVRGSGGIWTEKVLYSFSGGDDGGDPVGSLTIGRSGVLYGTTALGGSLHCNSGCGVIFELVAGENDTWQEKTLHHFKGGNDGSLPVDLVIDGSGALYGTAESNGIYGYGNIFEFKPDSSGQWTGKGLYSFTGGSDGGSPRGRLLFDNAGNLYGTALVGGTFGNGVAFKLIPTSSGEWTEQLLHNFGNEPDGSAPFGGLIFDSAGNLYGPAAYGGAYGSGVVFEITP